ncbi:LacI family transcription regulator [Agrobacterium sp. ATCC 31749]|uniref:LacI family DNA-binding transcriptional regulator n=1 Tax=unclassified Agrobacterium TaxID=2632611 RepID=UPI00020DC18D|nr:MULTISPECIES: LacI family DNA-binding transcriptional regulator [unclassified Agrobacterium]EGL62586.1 LacI family transcription regulator [Agrobacterium sp. ATCC 31749]QKW98971.1 substrate-binding domain-containing protein [Agrobacterium sp. CGMCC 11546]
MKGIRQLADYLQISIGTVSRALNGKPDVNEETRRRVLEAAEKLGYVANQSGRSLRQGTTNVIGLMTGSDAQTVENSDNFFLGVTDGLQSVFSGHNLDLIVLPCPGEEDPDEYLKRMVARRMVDAMIISATRRTDKRVDFLKQNRLPFVALGRTASSDDHAWIDLDFEGVAKNAVDRLVAAGHRSIAVAAPDSDINLGYVFLEGYRRALENNGIPYDSSLVVRAKSSEQGGYHAASEWLQMRPRPTAIVLIYELMAVGLYRRLAEAGLKPGQDLAVVGFRDGPRGQFLEPRLTSFRTSLHDLGVTVAQTLLSTMPAYAPFYPDQARHRVWPMLLVPGESDPPPAAQAAAPGGLKA